jgi:hypothetical protein
VGILVFVGSLGGLALDPSIARADETWQRLPSEDELAELRREVERPPAGQVRVTTRLLKLDDASTSDPVRSGRVLLNIAEVSGDVWHFAAAWLRQGPDGGFAWDYFMDSTGARGWWQSQLLAETGQYRQGWGSESASASAPIPAPREPVSNLAGVCASGGRAPAVVPTYALGTPGADGSNLQERLDPVTDQMAVTFRVTQPRAAFVYVGDQWYDLDLALFSITRDQGLACWQTTGARARSERHQGRAIQLIRPDEQILELIEPGDYALMIGLAPGAVYDPAHEFTVRVALTPPFCGSLSPANVPNPSYPNLIMRADDAWYQLGITIDPAEADRGPFSLLTFSAFVSPPYLDLYEFDWAMDGVPLAGVIEPMIQEPASHLPRPPHLHRVTVTARGVRDYPDPDQPHRPPTLMAQCTFPSP